MLRQLAQATILFDRAPDTPFGWNAHVEGLDYGGPLEVLYLGREWLILHSTGHTSWASRTHSSYAGPYYILFRHDMPADDIQERRLRSDRWFLPAACEMEEQPAGTQWRATERRMVRFITDISHYEPHYYIYPPTAKRCAQFLEL